MRFRIGEAAVLISSFLLITLSPRVLQAQTNVPAGTITTDTTWDLAGSPFILSGSVQVAANVTLTIAAGVMVKFSSLAPRLDVLGQLVADGTAQPITFTSFTDDANTAWGPIAFNAGASGLIKNAVLRFGGFKVGGVTPVPMVHIATGNSLVSVTNNTLTNSLTSAVLVTGAGTTPTISGNTISANSVGISGNSSGPPRENAGQTAWAVAS